MLQKSADLENVLSVVMTVYTARDSQNSRSLSGTRRPVEQQMRKTVLLNKLLDCASARVSQSSGKEQALTGRSDVLVRNHII